MYFKKRSDLVQAFQYAANGPTPVPDWFCAELTSGRACFSRAGALSPITIKTMFGEESLHPGDYAIRESDGEIWVCSAEDFERIYEPVSQEDT